MNSTTTLTRAAVTGRPAPPVRIVHLGLGAFHRAHQAWYTHAANTAGDQAWGIAAFHGRPSTRATALRDQDGLFHALVRGAEGDRADLVESLVAAHDGAAYDDWTAYLSRGEVGVVTLTVTEAGYCRAADGGVDLTNERLAGDLDCLAGGCEELVSAPARLVGGLAARRRADAGPIAVVPCDNLVGNGPAVARVVTELAEWYAERSGDRDFPAWLAENVSFVSTTVDRITPATTDADRAAVAELTGWSDAEPVVTEPFSEWVLAGDFPAGRPAWDLAGARLVTSVDGFERRKLWLLNGAHSLLAYAAPPRGHATVAEAVADPTCAGWMNDWWDAACRHLDLPEAELTAYRDALTDRFANPRIRHNLSQIAGDGSQKLPIRLLPVLRLERAAGRLPEGATRTLAGWYQHLRDGASVSDPRAEELLEIARSGPEQAVPRLLDVLDPQLGADAELVRAVVAATGR